jgi:hypothetical protein
MEVTEAIIVEEEEEEEEERGGGGEHDVDDEVSESIYALRFGVKCIFSVTLENELLRTLTLMGSNILAVLTTIAIPTYYDTYYRVATTADWIVPCDMARSQDNVRNVPSTFVCPSSVPEIPPCAIPQVSSTTTFFIPRTIVALFVTFPPRQ